MKIYIIIPVHNEELFIKKTLQSLVKQTFLPNRIVLVNDNSTDNTQTILDDFSEKYSYITNVKTHSEAIHSPGSKVVNAFNEGLAILNSDYDIICKFDADLIFPSDYLEHLKKIFEKNPKCGIAGGFCYIPVNNDWKLENLTNKNHVRGALKAYRKKCFLQIKGLKNTMGWDTVDELLAQYHGWQIHTDESLQVKHLKPTGQAYNKKTKYKQGEAFYKMRYGFWLTFIASLKLSYYKKSLFYFIHCLQGYYKSKSSNKKFIVSEKEGVYIRQLRWKGIRHKIF